MASTSKPVYVWTWLPGQREPVPAGALRRVQKRLQFGYAKSYLERTDAISLYGPELPLRPGWIDPPDGLTMASCLRDGSPDAWGRRVILDRLSGSSRPPSGLDTASLDEETYLLESGSNRFGANDFQTSPSRYVPRSVHATLDGLHEAAQRLAAGEHLSPELAAPLVHGTSIGGARPKALLVDDGGNEHIAKFSKSSDHFPVVNAEAAAMHLARLSGIDTPEVKVVQSLDREVLLVQRFDRPGDGTRVHAVSGLTMIGLDESFAHYGTYPEMFDVLRSFGKDPDVGTALFDRIAFNIAIGNTDDHARNHAAFWDGEHLALTPAYDLCPQARTGEVAAQAMAFDRDGTRSSDFASCMKAAHVYGLSKAQAHQSIDRIIHAINDNWDDVADLARLTDADRALLWQRQILNPYALYDYKTTAVRVGWNRHSATAAAEQPRERDGRFGFKHRGETDPGLGLE